MLPCIMEIALERSVVLHLAGEFDLLNRAELEGACRRVAEYDAVRRVHVDLSEVRYIDCPGLRAVIGLVDERHALGDPTTLVVTSPFLRTVLESMWLAEPDVIVDRLDDA